MGYFKGGETIISNVTFEGRLRENYMYKIVHVYTSNGCTQHVAVIQDNGEYHSFLGSAFRKV
jgi:hypothetical protein